MVFCHLFFVICIEFMRVKDLRKKYSKKFKAYSITGKSKNNPNHNGSDIVKNKGDRLLSDKLADAPD